MALTQLEKRIEQLLFGDTESQLTDDRASAAITANAELEEEIAKLYEKADPKSYLSLAESNLHALPSVAVDPFTSRRVQALARKRGEPIHATVRHLVRTGLTHAERKR